MLLFLFTFLDVLENFLLYRKFVWLMSETKWTKTFRWNVFFFFSKRNFYNFLLLFLFTFLELFGEFSFVQGICFVYEWNQVDKNISGEFKFFSGEKKMKEIEESSVGNVIFFFVVIFVYEWREHVFLLFIFTLV